MRRIILDRLRQRRVNSRVSSVVTRVSTVIWRHLCVAARFTNGVGSGSAVDLFIFERMTVGRGWEKDLRTSPLSPLKRVHRSVAATLHLLVFLHSHSHGRVFKVPRHGGGTPLRS
jgi:hypothetical protein